MYEEYFNFLNIDYQKRITLIKYASLVIDYNKNINITGAKNIEDFIKEHIIDSLLAFDLFKNYDNIIDIGSGAGLPSIPLSIIYDNKKFVLCESKNKKADFLKLAKKEICLNNIEVKCNVKLPNISVNNIEVQTYYGRIQENGVVDDISIIPMKLIEKDEKKNEYTYSAKINLINGGNYGYTFRAMPKHEMMLDSANLNLVKWITD